jgi:hypothetical protein
MKKGLVLILLIFLLVPLSGSAREPDAGTRADNECYEGGTMEGKCDTLWAWIGGWYVARYNQGIFTREQVPATYQILLPPPPPVVSTGADSPSLLPSPYPVGGCEQLAGYYVQFGGSYFIAGPAAYTNATCTTLVGVTAPFTVVYAPAGYDADFLCSEATGGTLPNSTMVDTNIYQCTT